MAHLTPGGPNPAPGAPGHQPPQYPGAAPQAPAGTPPAPQDPRPQHPGTGQPPFPPGQPGQPPFPPGHHGHSAPGGPGQPPAAHQGTGGQPAMAPQAPPQGPPIGPPPYARMPGAPGQGHQPPPAPQTPQPPGFADPVDTAGPTQHIQAVPAAPGSRNDRPLYRDEVPEDPGADTAQFDLQDLDDYDDYSDRPSGRSRGAGGGRTRILLVAGFVALLVVAGGGAFLFARNGASSGGSSDSGPEGPLAAESLFPETVDIGDAGTFTRVAAQDTEDCAAAAHGGYGTVLTEQSCEQVVRASYLSDDETRAVTVGIATMGTEGEAVTAQGEQDLVGASWFAGLAGEEGSNAERLGFSGGYGSSGQWGNHIVFSLAANSDGTDADEDSEVATELQTIGEGFLDEAFGLLSGGGD